MCECVCESVCLGGHISPLSGRADQLHWPTFLVPEAHRPGCPSAPQGLAHHVGLIHGWTQVRGECSSVQRNGPRRRLRFVLAPQCTARGGTLAADLQGEKSGAGAAGRGQFPAALTRARPRGHRPGLGLSFAVWEVGVSRCTSPSTAPRASVSPGNERGTHSPVPSALTGPRGHRGPSVPAESVERASRVRRGRRCCLGAAAPTWSELPPREAAGPISQGSPQDPGRGGPRDQRARDLHKSEPSTHPPASSLPSPARVPGLVPPKEWVRLPGSPSSSCGNSFMDQPSVMFL